MKYTLKIIVALAVFAAYAHGEETTTDMVDVTNMSSSAHTEIDTTEMTTEEIMDTSEGSVPFETSTSTSTSTPTPTPTSAPTTSTTSGARMQLPTFVAILAAFFFVLVAL